LAAGSPVVLHYAFGAEFVEGVPIVIVLLAAAIPGAGLQLMNSAVSNAGRPGLTASAQVLALCITVPGLIVALPAFGTIGAAFVSLLAYTMAFLLQLRYTRRLFELSTRRLLVFERADLVWARGLVGDRFGRRST
jgi:O-antigen/teichoic acid export membrane protein